MEKRMDDMLGPSLLPTSGIQSLDHAEAFLKIDSEISQLEARLLYLRGHRNTLPPVSTLPNEILAKIFLECHEVDIEPVYNFDEPMDKPGDSRRGKTRLTLSWISSRWRSVALSIIDLWSFVTDGHRDYADACITRSMGLDLSIAISTGQLVRACFLQTHRLKSLKINFTGIDEDDVTPLFDEGLWSQSALLLQSLSIHDGCLHSPWMEIPPLFGGIYPRLQHLSITKSAFKWPILLGTANALTSLYVKDPTNNIRGRDLADILGTMPALAECKFDRCLKDVVYPGGLGPRSPVGLPNLRHFTLCDSYHYFPFLNHVDLNPHTSIHFIAYDCNPDSSGFFQVFQYLESYQNRNPQWAKQEIRHISIDHTNPLLFLFTMSTSPATLVESLGSAAMKHETLNFTIEIPTSRPAVVDFGVLLFDHMPFTPNSLETVHLKGVSRETVLEFSRATALRVLKLSSLVEKEGIDGDTCLSIVRADDPNRDPGPPTDAPDGLYHSVELLEVDRVEYNSFGDFHTSMVEKACIDSPRR